jgi:hypothetical protein
MMTEFSDAGTPVSDAQIDEVETALGFPLPADYRHFLRTYNGGVPDDDTIDIADLKQSPTDVQELFGIDYASKTSNILWNLDFIRQRCPGRRLLPIGCDSGGNLFCLDFAQERNPSVIYLDLIPADCQAHLICGTFSEFCDLLRKNEMD